jgi:proteasome assembly chaperone (PAC2) family protein|tara:strand:- start:963 stop:1265 length:303 start_codon:yes stop_codon:yes gene_type:complete
MDLKDIAVPGITLVFAAGISFASFESSAQEVDELGTRLSVLESRKDVNLGKQEVVDVKIEGIEKRLEKMEEIVQRMLEMQQKQAVSVAKICQATNADCSN